MQSGCLGFKLELLTGQVSPAGELLFNTRFARPAGHPSGRSTHFVLLLWQRKCNQKKAQQALSPFGSPIQLINALCAFVVTFLSRQKK
jgi:hypothetical protein